jgi:hypothetical protein
MINGPQRPDPWSDEVATEIAKDDAVPLCHRCLIHSFYVTTRA